MIKKAAIFLVASVGFSACERNAAEIHPGQDDKLTVIYRPLYISSPISYTEEALRKNGKVIELTENSEGAELFDDMNSRCQAYSQGSPPKMDYAIIFERKNIKGITEYSIAASPFLYKTSHRPGVFCEISAAQRASLERILGSVAVSG